MAETLAASRCPRCRRLVAPLGEVVSFTTLHSPPEGFRAPLHIALVELEGGARLFCHGDETAPTCRGRRWTRSSISRTWASPIGPGSSGAARARGASGSPPSARALSRACGTGGPTTRIRSREPLQGEMADGVRLSESGDDSHHGGDP
jgi:hypothetical protein